MKFSIWKTNKILWNSSESTM